MKHCKAGCFSPRFHLARGFNLVCDHRVSLITSPVPFRTQQSEGTITNQRHGLLRYNIISLSRGGMCQGAARRRNAVLLGWLAAEEDNRFKEHQGSVFSLRSRSKLSASARPPWAASFPQTLQTLPLRSRKLHHSFPKGESMHLLLPAWAGSSSDDNAGALYLQTQVSDKAMHS